MKRLVEVVAYETDLMFSSRIESAAARAGVTVKFVSTLQELAECLGQTTYKALIVNLDAATGQLVELGAIVREGHVKTVGYYSHVNSLLAAEARRVGIGVVLTRAAFAARIDEVLKDVHSGD